MKSLAACTIVLALAACGTSNNTTTTSSGSGTGAKSTGTTTGTASGGRGSSTGSAAGSSTGSPLGTRCTYDPSTGVDSCSDVGYECTGEFTNAATGTCVLPHDLGVCDGDPNGSVGCQDGGIPNGTDAGSGDLFCTNGGFSNPNIGTVSLCLYPCNGTADCAIGIQDCLTQAPYNGGCFDNTCGQDPSTGAFVGPFYGTCPVLDAGDGQCLSFNTGGFALCFQNGTANVGEPCNPTFRFGAFSECKYSSSCWPNAGGDGGLCLPVAPSDGGSCGAGNIAVGQTGADWGVCVQDCTTSMSCDGGYAGTTCQTAGTKSACLP
jgi:hypothetical protein